MALYGLAALACVHVYGCGDEPPDNSRPQEEAPCRLPLVLWCDEDCPTREEVLRDLTYLCVPPSESRCDGGLRLECGYIPYTYYFDHDGAVVGVELFQSAAHCAEADDGRTYEFGEILTHCVPL